MNVAAREKAYAPAPWSSSPRNVPATAPSAGHLRERQVHEDDLPFQNVKAQISMDPDQDQAGAERRGHEADEVAHFPYFSPPVTFATRESIQAS